ncbi:MAG: T9SS type A sorting domain-containing protein [bacterium]|nr:T9SS type A sorting domain-containing protein [bacterium]
MGIINNLIYFAGGNIGGATGAEYNTILRYDISTNAWALDTRLLSSKRHWMATAEYKGGLYVVGGIDSVAQAVDVVEEIVPQGTAGVEGEFSSINGFELFQNFPNPFNPRTVISYQIPVSSDVTLKVFDVLGNEIATLVDEYKPAGKYEVEFNSSGILDLASGIYFYQLKAGNFKNTKKMILLK